MGPSPPCCCFWQDEDEIGREALEDTRVLLMTAVPINEKVVLHGPFVMNNETQILEAMRDYQKGKMGVLIEHQWCLPSSLHHRFVI